MGAVDAPPAMRVLVVDDEPAVRDALERALRVQGYDVAVARDGDDGLRVLRTTNWDAVILDVMMPARDGVSVCRSMRDAGDLTPVLMLTAKDAVSDRVVGLDAGADDYLVKPFALDELLARLRALLRRTGAQPGGPALRFADLELHPETHSASRDGRSFELTRTEYLLLELFLSNPRKVLTRSVIFERVWGYDFGSTSNSLEVYIGYLRRKMEAGGEKRLIQTIRGVGYVLREP